MPTALELDPAYRATRILDDLRARDYRRLDATAQVYLDYTGAGLYGASQVTAHQRLLQAHVYGNPHSANAASQLATTLLERARARVLRFFHADPDEYLAIFTANASGALKLVGESYPFAAGRYLLTVDNHNSVNGIREFAHAQGADVSYVPIALPDMRVVEEALRKELARPHAGRHNLFAYPAQSNFSSVQHPLQWVERAHAFGWDVLLDAAAFVPTNRLDLGQVRPDFVSISFYKMFGYPTGVGALIARREALGRLRRPWFAGGTITVASVQAGRYFLADGAPAFEDGTPDFLNIPAVEVGLRQLESIGYDIVHERVRCLTGWLLQHLLQLRHANGQSLVRVFGPADTERRGGAVTVNFYDEHGRPFDHLFIEKAAKEMGIALRTGCFCNPGAGEVALGITRSELETCFRQPGHETHFTVDDYRVCRDGKPTGAVRISVGLVSNAADVEAVLAFARSLLDRAGRTHALGNGAGRPDGKVTGSRVAGPPLVRS